MMNVDKSNELVCFNFKMFYVTNLFLQQQLETTNKYKENSIQQSLSSFIVMEQSDQ
jgi:hypothetical protein